MLLPTATRYIKNVRYQNIQYNGMSTAATKNKSVLYREIVKTLGYRDIISQLSNKNLVTINKLSGFNCNHKNSTSKTIVNRNISSLLQTQHQSQKQPYTLTQPYRGLSTSSALAVAGNIEFWGAL